MRGANLNDFRGHDTPRRWRIGLRRLIQSLHIPFEIHIKKLENEIQFRISMDDILKSIRRNTMRSVKWQRGGNAFRRRSASKIEEAKYQETLYEPYDVVILQFLQEGYLSYGGGGHPFVLCFEAYFLERDDLTGTNLFRFIHHSVCTWNRQRV
jgi:hypothetical protein